MTTTRPAVADRLDPVTTRPPNGGPSAAEETAPLLAALIAERNAGDWYARRVAEHTGRRHGQGQPRAQAAAATLKVLNG